jgi:uncharacterized glyoxalase superfamily protein PhnB
MPRIVGARSVLAVRDLQISTRHYMDVLGFRRDFGDGTDGWSFLSRDGFKVMLGECSDEKPASELGNHSYIAYVTVEGIDKIYSELVARGAHVTSAPTDKAWGLREFTLRTPDGHRYTFGEPLNP